MLIKADVGEVDALCPGIVRCPLFRFVGRTLPAWMRGRRSRSPDPQRGPLAPLGIGAVNNRQGPHSKLKAGVLHQAALEVTELPGARISRRVSHLA